MIDDIHDRPMRLVHGVVAGAVLVAVVLVSGCGPSFPVLSMNADQIQAVSDDSICGTMACSAQLTTAMRLEMSRRHLSCLDIVYTCTSADPSVRASPALQTRFR